MTNIHSTVTDMPRSCKSAAEHLEQSMAKEDRYADITPSCREKITELENSLSQESGEQVVLVAYKN